jgi:hypothetical protein
MKDGGNAVDMAWVVLGIMVSDRENMNVMSTSAKTLNILIGNIAHPASVRRIGTHDVGDGVLLRDHD